MADSKNIIIFTPRADSALSEIIKKHNLEQYLALVKIDFISKEFVAEKKSEKEMIDYLQKELKISAQISEKISKEIINNIIPFLVKTPEEKFNDPNFIEELSEKVFGTKNKEVQTVPPKVISEIKPPIGVAEALRQKTPASKESLAKQDLIIGKESVMLEPEKKPLPKTKAASEEASLAQKGREPAPKPKIKRNDNYRESIE